MPELPRAMGERFQRDGLPAYDAAMMTQSRPGPFFEAAAKNAAANQAGGQLADGRGVAAPQRRRPAIEASPVSAAQLAALIGRIADGTISNNARQVFDALWDQARAARSIRSSRPRA